MNAPPSEPNGAGAVSPSHAEFARPEAEEKSLDRILVRGIAWTGAVKWISQVLSWLSTIVVARLLKPEDYGLVAMAGVFLGFISLLNEFGLGAAIVTLRHLTREQIARIHSLACLFGIGGFLFASLASVSAGKFFRSSEVTLIMLAGGIGFVFSGMRSVPSALCEKELRFKFLAFLEGGQSIVTTLVTVWLAWSGGGYWSLVLGGLAGNATATIVLWITRPVQLAWPSFVGLKETLQMSAHLIVGRVSWYLASSSDVFIGGRVLGQVMVGTYSFASTIANVPFEKVASLASRVMPALYSSVQSDPIALRRYFLILTEGISLITFPAGIGMALVTQDFVTLFLGVKWQEVVVPLQILACWASLRSIVALMSPIMIVTGNARLGMVNAIFCAVTYPAAFWVGSQFGVVGLALAWVVAQPLSWVTPYRCVFQATGLSLKNYILALWPALSAVTFMGACVWSVQHLLPDQLLLLNRFMLEFGAGVIAYGMAVLILHRGRVMKLLKVIKDSRA